MTVFVDTAPTPAHCPFIKHVYLHQSCRNLIIFNKRHATQLNIYELSTSSSPTPISAHCSSNK